MKNKIFYVVVTMVSLTILVSISHATIIEITEPALTHFANFSNDPPAGAISHISSDVPAGWYGDFGWHDSPYELMPEYAGIILESQYAVTTLRLQVHVNPFKNFILQGSTNTTTGLDGSWDNILTSTVTNRSELDWQEWNFSNTNLYSAYRFQIEDAYVGGWAMYRWELLADNNINPVPEPGSLLLFMSGLLGMIGLKRKVVGSYLEL